MARGDLARIASRGGMAVCGGVNNFDSKAPPKGRVGNRQSNDAATDNEYPVVRSVCHASHPTRELSDARWLVHAA
jgi:hypothetical protein